MAADFLPQGVSVYTKVEIVIPVGQKCRTKGEASSMIDDTFRATKFLLLCFHADLASSSSVEYKLVSHIANNTHKKSISEITKGEGIHINVRSDRGPSIMINCVIHVLTQDKYRHALTPRVCNRRSI
jgi:hypothetical protein